MKPPSKDTYRIIEERDLDKFQRRANTLIEQGWEPQGGLVVGTSRYLQAFVQRRQKGHVAGFKISFGLATSKSKEATMPSETSITNEQKIPATVTPLSEAGKAAKLDGPLFWSVTSGTGTVGTVGADGLTAELVSGDDPGDTTYLIKGDADLGSGVVEVSDTIVLHVLGAMAAHLGIEFGAAVPK